MNRPWYKTDRPVRSEVVQKLFIEGRAKDLTQAIDNSKATGIGSYKGITVKKVGMKDVDGGKL